VHRVSAYILTFNEAEKIADAIKSVATDPALRV
jgi:hypothetical protein